VIAIPEADEKDLAVDDAEGQLEDDMLAQNALALEAQLEERPLAKKQEKLTEEEDKEAEADKAKANGESVASVGEEGEGEEGRPPDEGGGNEVGEGNDEAQSNGSSTPEGSNAAVGKHQGHHHKKALLHNDDTELTRVGKVRDTLVEAVVRP
jgi:RNA polymerase II subunit A-like phosphatase